MKRQAQWETIWKYVTLQRKNFIQALMCFIAVSITSALFPLILRYMLDTWHKLQISDIVKLTFVLGIIAICQALISAIGNYLYSVAVQNMLISIRSDAFKTLLDRPLQYFAKMREGSFTSVFINDLGSVTQIVAGGLLSLFTDVFTLLVMFFVMFYLEWKLSLLILCVMVIFICMYRVFGPKILNESRSYRSELADMTGMVHEAYAGARTIKAYGQECAYTTNFTAELQRVARRYNHMVLYEIGMSKTGSLISSAALIGSVSYMGYLLVNGECSLGTAVSYLSLISAVFSPLKDILKLGAQYQEALAAASRVATLLDTDKLHLAIKSPQRTAVHCDGAELTVREVHYSYETAEVLKGISMTLNRGDWVLIRGASGAGKSTLVDLLAGFLIPSEGSIEVCGIDITPADSRVILSHISLVQQDTYVFNDTLRNNLLFGKTNATDAELMESLKIASLMDWFNRLENGLDTILGERGLLMSGGERQRLSIARAVLKDGDVYIFDEATSCLDPMTEKFVWENLKKLFTDKVVIAISHDDHTAFPANRLLTLASGIFID